MLSVTPLNCLFRTWLKNGVAVLFFDYFSGCYSAIQNWYPEMSNTIDLAGLLFLVLFVYSFNACHIFIPTFSCPTFSGPAFFILRFPVMCFPVALICRFCPISSLVFWCLVFHSCVFSIPECMHTMHIPLFFDSFMTEFMGTKNSSPSVKYWFFVMISETLQVLHP